MERKGLKGKATWPTMGLSDKEFQIHDDLRARALLIMRDEGHVPQY